MLIISGVDNSTTPFRAMWGNSGVFFCKWKVREVLIYRQSVLSHDKSLSIWSLFSADFQC